MTEQRTSTFHFRQITTLLRRRWKLIGSILLAAVLIAATLGLLNPPRYTAKAQMLYEAQATLDGNVASDSEIETLVELLISPGHLRAVAESFDKEPLVLAAPEAPADAEKPAWSSMPIRWLRSLAPPPPVGPPSVEELDRSLIVYKERRSRLIAVTFTSPDPQIAAAVANRVAELYLDTETQRRAAARDRSLERIEERMAAARRELDDTEKTLRAQQMALGVVNDENIPVDPRSVELVRQRNLTLEALAQLGGGFLPRTDSLPVTGDDRNAAWSGEGIGMASRTASTEGPQAVLNTVQRETGALTEAEALERQMLLSRLDEIDQRLQAIQGADARGAAAYLQLRHLQRDVVTKEEAFRNLADRQADLSSQGIGVLPARIASVATPPVEPSSPGPLLFVLPAFGAALVLGGLLAILVERMDRRLYNEQDIAAELGLPCIGLVPQIREREALSLLTGNRFAPYTEAIRSVLSASMKDAASAQPPDETALAAGHASAVSQRLGTSLLITSSQAGEGKSGMAASYAAYAALIGRKVLLVDWNFRNPRLTATFAPHAAETCYLQGDQPVRQAICRIDALGVDFLPMPRDVPDPLAVISAGVIPVLLDQFCRDYDLVVLDSAALINATETRALASMVDKVLLVVRWGVTEGQTARKALHMLRSTAGEDAAPDFAVFTGVDLRAYRKFRYDEAGPAPAGRFGPSLSSA